MGPDASRVCVAPFKAQLPRRGVCPGSGVSLTPAHTDGQGAAGPPRGEGDGPRLSAAWAGRVATLWQTASPAEPDSPPALRQPPRGQGAWDAPVIVRSHRSEQATAPLSFRVPGSGCDSTAGLVRGPLPCENLHPAGRTPATCSAPRTGHGCSGPSVRPVLQRDRYQAPLRVKRPRDCDV